MKVVECSYVNYSEKVLQKVFHCVLIYFHLMCNKLNECDKHDYVYKGITQYIDLLFYMERYEGGAGVKCYNRY